MLFAAVIAMNLPVARACSVLTILRESQSSRLYP